MIRLGTDPSASSGISLEVTCRGGNKRVSLRGWHTDVVTIEPLHFTLEEFAGSLGLTIPPYPPRKKPARSST